MNLLIPFIFFLLGILLTITLLYNKNDTFRFFLLRTIQGNRSENTRSNFDSIIKESDVKIPVTSIPFKTDEEKIKLENSVEFLQKKIDYLNIISELGQLITSCLDPEKIHNYLTETLKSIMDAEVVELSLFQNREINLRILTNHPSFTTPQNSYINPYVEWALENNKEVIVDHAKENFGRFVFSPLILPDQSIPQSIFCFPMIRNDREIGTLTVMSYRPDAYNEKQADMLRSLLPYLSVALENAFVHAELKMTQQQMIHNERMASLGQLTSGIAHEIQNPLNFVNNFSESSIILLEDINKCSSEKEKSEILNELKINLDKIYHHGKRADGIIKNMLIHSRKSEKGKANIDINVLCKENLTLAYNSMLAKYVNFTCKLSTEFNPSMPKVLGHSQDLGRVLINLLNNSFYSVNEKIVKSKHENVVYSPEVKISTDYDNFVLLIKVWDNGMGIPVNLIDKIFQPFFTTKPTGEGTGLGLSMSYDIITTGHLGRIEAVTEYGKFMEIIVSLPIIS